MTEYTDFSVSSLHQRLFLLLQYFIGISFSLSILLKPAYRFHLLCSLFFPVIGAFGKDIIDSYSTELSDDPVFDQTERN